MSTLIQCSEQCSVYTPTLKAVQCAHSNNKQCSVYTPREQWSVYTYTVNRAVCTLTVHIAVCTLAQLPVASAVYSSDSVVWGQCSALGQSSLTLYWIYCTLLYFTGRYSTILHCILLYSTLLWCTLYCPVLYWIVLYCTALYCTPWYCQPQDCTEMDFTKLYCNGVKWNALQRILNYFVLIVCIRMKNISLHNKVHDVHQRTVHYSTIQ